MRTVKEVSRITGISVRTLHYYDEIGLLKPTECKENGYRLYNDKALETLQQILFFKEFDVPLKKIKSIMETPDFDKEIMLRSQYRFLQLKRDRLNRLLCSMEAILKGENKMDFEVFSKAELDELYQAMIHNMDAKQLQAIVEQYGELKHYRENFLQHAGEQKTQENLKKVVEWYGSREKAMDAAKNPASKEILEAYQNRITEIYQKLADMQDKDITSFEVKSVIGEYDFVAKQLYQMDDVAKLMREMAESFISDEKMASAMDQQYGAGASCYIGNAMKEFYKE